MIRMRLMMLAVSPIRPHHPHPPTRAITKVLLQQVRTLGSIHPSLTPSTDLCTARHNVELKKEVGEEESLFSVFLGSFTVLAHEVSEEHIEETRERRKKVDIF